MWLAATLALTTPQAGNAEPGPGDVFREYVWGGPFINANRWQRVTDPDATAPGAHEFLPNPVNRVVVEDLEHAIGAEIYLQLWSGHAGTSGKGVRINGHWIAVEDPPAIPGRAGLVRESSASCYHHFTYPSMPVPLSALQQGDNTLEFTAGRQVCGDFGWGQWGVHGAAIRIYYDPERKPHPQGRVVSPLPGHVLRDSVTVAARIADESTPVTDVAFIAEYEDFDHDGDGVWREWQYVTWLGRMRRHIDSAREAPFAVDWDLGWIPEQHEPLRIMARLVDDSGLISLTDPVGNLRLDRGRRTVHLYKPYNVPVGWQSRAGRGHGSRVFIPHDLQHALDARVMYYGQFGGAGHDLRVNGTTIHTSVGNGLGIRPVDLSLLQPAGNTMSTFSSTLHHGIEIMWPGIVLMVRYDDLPEPVAATRDLVLFDGSVANDWSIEGPENGNRVVDEALRVTPSPTFNWLVDLTTMHPVPTEGFSELRFAINVDEVDLRSWHRLAVKGPDSQDVALLRRGEGAYGFDPDAAGWQSVVVPLEDLDLPVPYVGAVRFEGNVQGDILLNDIRFVLDRQTAVGGEAGAQNVPDAAHLLPNYPNPFNGSTVISFSLATPGAVDLALYNLAGQRVATLASGPHGSGTHSVRWTGQDAAGQRVASGVYLARLRAGEQAMTRQMLLLR